MLPSWEFSIISVHFANKFGMFARLKNISKFWILKQCMGWVSYQEVKEWNLYWLKGLVSIYWEYDHHYQYRLHLLIYIVTKYPVKIVYSSICQTNGILISKTFYKPLYTTSFDKLLQKRIFSTSFHFPLL